MVLETATTTGVTTEETTTWWGCVFCYCVMHVGHRMDDRRMSSSKTYSTVIPSTKIPGEQTDTTTHSTDSSQSKRIPKIKNKILFLSTSTLSQQRNDSHTTPPRSDHPTEQRLKTFTSWLHTSPNQSLFLCSLPWWRKRASPRPLWRCLEKNRRLAVSHAALDLLL